ncbi:FliH/SctL family protein [Histidinibacterium aquaticum]|nr:FliH/SctL family protein [Histidinibacterium aquaticum]
MDPVILQNFDELDEPIGGPPLYDAEALDAARTAAFAEGHAAGKADGLEEAARSLQAREAETLERLGDRIRTLQQGAEAHRTALEEQVLAFVLQIAEQVFPEFITDHGPARAETELRRTVRMALGSPTLTISVSPEVLPGIRRAIDLAAEAQDYPGQLEIRADEALAPGDATAAWQTGFMEYSYAAICDRILASLRAKQPQPRNDTPSRSKEHE